MEEKSPWPLALKYGLIMAFVHIIINIIFYIIAPDAGSKEGFSLLGVIQFLLTAGLSIAVFYMATKIRRDEETGGYITYNRSLSFMLAVSLPAALIISFYTFIFFKYINPEMFEKIWESQAETMYNSGKSDEEVEQALKYVKMFSSPMAMTVFGAFGIFIELLIFALITSIFTRKTPPVEDIR